MKNISLPAISIILILGVPFIGCQQNDQAQLTEAKEAAEFHQRTDSMEQELYSMVEKKLKEFEARGIGRDSALQIWRTRINQEFADYLTSQGLDADSVIQAQGLKIE
ncbi:MAG: hypothetical protein AAGI38_17265 [Bacteroidota bacterium]